MAGKNTVLEPGQILFKKGDKSQGMYIVRTGELKVFIANESGQEVSLANIPAGGMIGEMALFDQNPRSASVKALDKTEVTFISEEDFKKLTTQIPKWFTTLMGTLVGRLRATNDRLHDLESKSPAAGIKRITVIQRILYLLDLLWHRDGDKEKKAKEWSLEIKAIKEVICDQLCEDVNMLNKLVNVIVKLGLYELKKNEFKNDVITTLNRGDLSRILTYLSQYTKNSPRSPLPKPCLDLLDTVVVLSQSSGFDVMTFPISALEKSGAEQGFTITEWKKNLSHFALVGDVIKVVPAPNGDSIIKARKKDIKDLSTCHKLLAALYDAIG